MRCTILIGYALRCRETNLPWYACPSAFSQLNSRAEEGRSFCHSSSSGGKINIVGCSSFDGLNIIVFALGRDINGDNMSLGPVNCCRQADTFPAKSFPTLAIRLTAPYFGYQPLRPNATLTRSRLAIAFLSFDDTRCPHCLITQTTLRTMLLKMQTT